MDGLHLLCEVALCKAINVENVATLLVIGETEGADQLKEECMDFIKVNAPAVMASAGWKQAASFGGNVSLISEVCSALAGGRKRRRSDEMHAPEKEAAAVDEMSMAQIRSDLQRRQLNCCGRRSVVVVRLKEAIAKGTKDGNDKSSSSSSSSSSAGSAQ